MNIKRYFGTKSLVLKSTIMLYIRPLIKDNKEVYNRL